MFGTFWTSRNTHNSRNLQPERYVAQRCHEKEEGVQVLHEAIKTAEWLRVPYDRSGTYGRVMQAFASPSRQILILAQKICCSNPALAWTRMEQLRNKREIRA